MTTTLSKLVEAWEDAQSGIGHVVWLRSQVGTGKSAMLRSFFQAVDKMPQESAIVFCRCGDASIVSTSDHGELEALIAQIAEGFRAFGATEDTDEAQNDVHWCLPSLDFLSTSIHLSDVTQGLNLEDNHRLESHLGVLFDIARIRPICLILDDVQRSDKQSVQLLKAIDRRLRDAPGVQLLLIASDTVPLKNKSDTKLEDEVDNGQPHMFERSRADVIEFICDRVSPFGQPSEAYIERIIDICGSNFLAAKALIKLSEYYQALQVNDEGLCDDPDLETYPQCPRLLELAQGYVPSLPANLKADLEQTSVFGGEIRPEIMAELWSVPVQAAKLRLDALINTGMVLQEGQQLRFLSEELAAQFRDQLPHQERGKIHRKIAQILRGRARSSITPTDTFPHFIDVTDTWRDSHKRDQLSKQEFDLLWTAVSHFSKGDRPTLSAESAVTLVERLFDTSGGHSYLAGTAGRRSDRERRHRIYAVLTEAENQINRAIKNPSAPTDSHELLGIKIRLYNVKSRFKQVMGDFLEAKRYSELAVELSTGDVAQQIKIEALRVQLEVNYASGDTHAARQGLSRLMRELDGADEAICVHVLSWLAEAVGRWEWYGLQERMFEVILSRLVEMNAETAVNKVQLEWLAASAQAEMLDRSERLVERFINEARSDASKGDFAEQLARFASELNHARVDTHFDLLSGEYYSADLLNNEASVQLFHLTERLTLVQDWFREAERLAKDSQSALTQLRVAAIELGTIYESRERLFELLDKWGRVAPDDRPSALQDVVHILESGFFATDQVERLTLFIIGLSRDLELYQIIGDTIYEALERETPSIIEEAENYFEIAEAAYQEVDDVYGLLTLTLVRLRQIIRAGGDTTDLTHNAESILNATTEGLTSEQRAFVHYRLGDHYLKAHDDDQRGVEHLEKAITLYDLVGDMNHIQTIAEKLTERYKQAGDLSKFRSIRERFNQFDLYNDGVDPLGLELRIEHLLHRARSEEDEIKAIGMVEECVQLFSRVPDGTTRIDECFVEISKICRRRAERSETEAGHEDWLHRSLEAVRIAVSINRSLGNYFRVFEEYHELFEDLLGLGLYEEYLRTRAENRELAFAVGNISELVYLFEEHLQFDPEDDIPIMNLQDLRGFYEALSRYIQGLGARDDAHQLQRTFVSFLVACGEHELAEHYRTIYSLDPSPSATLTVLEESEFEQLT